LLPIASDLLEVIGIVTRLTRIDELKHGNPADVSACQIGMSEVGSWLAADH